METSRQSRTTTTQKIIVMLSSRCSDPISFDGEQHTMTDFRKKLKDQLERVTLLGSKQKVFQVWMNEDERSSGQTSRTWERCMKEVRGADIVLVLYNGNSGWASEQGGIGICHGELEHALNKTPHKVRIVQLGILPEPSEDDLGKRNRLFQDYVERQELNREMAADGNEAFVLCKKAVFQAVLEMTRLGARTNARGGFFMGDPLQWSELSFEERSARMVATLCDELMHRQGAVRKEGHVLLPFYGQSVLFLCHAIPAALSIPAARETVGQPFLRDHKYAKLLGDEHAGPVHIIACHRTVTESQAIKQLGFPDATVVTPPFGVYVADNVQKIQLVFIANCRDETTTREGVQRFFAWLRQTGEGADFAARAAARKRIVAAIDREVLPGEAR